MDINDYLLACIQQNASDLHLSPHFPPMLRIDGKLTPLAQPHIDPSQLKQSLKQGLDDNQWQMFQQQQQLDYSFSFHHQHRFRAHIFLQEQGISAAFRYLNPSLPKADLQAHPIIHRISQYPHGLVLITGSTGSGKSTTLAAIIDYVNQHQQRHIITLEDPIEFIYRNRQCLISQRQVGLHVASFEQGLYGALRQDPDILLVGECRHPDTIRLVLTAAETGHLVLTSLHTRSAVHTLTRLIDSFPSAEKNFIATLLSESLQAIISQQLIQRISGGRVAAMEILLSTPAVRHLIKEHKYGQIHNIMQTSQHLGMQTLAQHQQALFEKKLIHNPIA